MTLKLAEGATSSEARDDSGVLMRQALVAMRRLHHALLVDELEGRRSQNSSTVGAIRAATNLLGMYVEES